MHEAVVVGSGFGGLAAAIALARQGYTDVVVLERAADLGGTWRDNRYPGCAVDVPSALYSFSFAPWPGWSHTYARQSQIWDYLRRVATDFGVAERIRYGEALVEATYRDGVWQLRTKAGTRLTTRALVLATGALSEPSVPRIPGLDTFGGKVFHTARWPQDDTGAIDGRRVAVVGTGASAVQVVPALAERVAHLTVLQRTPSWILPLADHRIGEATRRRYALLPWLLRAQRLRIYWRNESRVLAFTRQPTALGLLERLARRHLARQVHDPRVRAALTPSYRIGCKRILLSNRYLRTFNRPDVTLVTAPIERIEPGAVVTGDGRRHPVDTIVLGTGFAVEDPHPGLTVRGPDGRSLKEVWERGATAHLGVSVAGFPNLFLITGPNSGLGHSSMVFMIEAQAHYLTRCLALRDAAGARSVSVRAQVQDQFNAGLERRSTRTVWATGCRSWYLDRFGHNRTLWPSSTVDYWIRTRRARPDEHLLEDS